MMGVKEFIRGAQPLSDHDQKQVDRFQRYLRGQMDPHEHYAYVFGEPMSSANDPTTYGMGV